MWYKKYRDERVEAAKSQIFRELYYLMMGFAGISVIVKSIMYPENWKASFFELLLIIFSSVYYILRSVQKGLYTDEIEVHDQQNKRSMSQKNLLIGLGSGIAIALFFGIRSALVFGGEGTTILFFFFSFIASLMIYIPFFVGFMVIGDQLARKASLRNANKQDEE
jgi:hypothetical protein